MVTCAIPISSSHRKSRGFTLIEILVVVFIVAILSGVVVANLPSFARTGDLDEEARRVQALLALARTEAQLQAQEFGFRVLADGYEFFTFDDREQRWQRVEQRPLAPRNLPADLALRLKIEATELALPVAADSPAQPDRTVPPVLLLSSGETTPFELTLATQAGETRVLIADGYSALAWDDDDAP